MPARTTSPPSPRLSDRATSHRPRSLLGRPIVIAVLAALFVIGALFAIFVASGGGGDDAYSGDYPYEVGNPGPGEPAPPLRLPSTAGGEFDLADQEGQRVMLYFQEGVMCQACWDQLHDIEARWDDFEAHGIDSIVSISSDPLGVLEDKAQLEDLGTPLLSDPGVAASSTYEANLYGMMGTSMNGHSFVIVGPDGTIEWRADYGGEPLYIMYLPVDELLADMTEGLGTSGQAG